MIQMNSPYFTAKSFEKMTPSIDFNIDKPMYDGNNSDLTRDFKNDIPENGLIDYITESSNDEISEKEHAYYILWKNELMNYLENEPYDNACIPEAETFINHTLDKMQNEGKLWLNRFFNEQWENDCRNYLRGLLATIAYIDYDKLKPVGVTMALAALSHEDVEVVQCAVQAFEGWGKSFGIKYLVHVHTDYVWLNDYINAVVQNLKGVRKSV